jgi:hypothetical protein
MMASNGTGEITAAISAVVSVRATRDGDPIPPSEAFGPVGSVDRPLASNQTP